MGACYSYNTMKNKTFVLILIGLISTSAFIGAQAPVRNEADELAQAIEKVLIKHVQFRQVVADNAALLDDANSQAVEVAFRNQQVAMEQAIDVVRILREKQKNGYSLE